MGAAPLQAPAVEIHLGVVAVQDGPLVVPNQFNQRFVFAIGEKMPKTANFKAAATHS